MRDVSRVWKRKGIKCFLGNSCLRSLRTSLFNVFSTESESETTKQMSQVAPLMVFIKQQLGVQGVSSQSTGGLALRKLGTCNKIRCVYVSSSAVKF